jgi:hypothetical protein
LKPHGFADTPPDPVPHNGFAESPGRSKSDARAAVCGFTKAERREQRTGKAGSFVVNSPEIFRSQQADTFRKTWDGRLPFVANRELFAAPGAAAGQYGAPILGFHAAAETVGFRAVAIIRLKSTFRHFSSSI